MKKQTLILALLLIIAKAGIAQQDPQFSQYMFNQMSINPGYAGSADMICITGINRQQWVGFEGAPSSTVFHANAPIKPFGINSGVGLTLINDKAGFNDNLSISATYAYRIDIGEGKLGIGANFGFLNQKLSPEWYIPTSDYHQQPSGDPLIPENDESVFVFDMGFGIYYNTNNLYIGISSTHINEPNLSYTKGTPFIKRNYYLTAGYSFQLSNPLFEIIPSIQVVSDAATSSITFNTNVTYNKKFWGGVSYRAGSAIVGLIGLQIFNGVRFGYAYEFPTSDIIKSTSGSHEFMISYCFSVAGDRTAKKYKSIRFL
ncbi:MAG: hypothetical protein DRI73_05675 [Bacteroidetes bacterium]|nr:MAG: hypothetical protein DRI73_05675 [Bacteroidota bacterium]